MQRVHSHTSSILYLSLLMSGLLILTACQSTPSATKTEADNIEVESSNLKYESMPAIPADIQNSTSGDEMIALMAPTFEDIESFYKQWENTESFEKRDALARTMLEKHQQREDFYLRSIVAESALIAALQSDSPSERVSAIEMYTSVLLENDTFNTVLMNDALNALKGSWSAAKVNASAQQTMDHALDWLERTKDISQDKALSANRSIEESRTVSAHQSTRESVQTGIQALSATVGTS